MKRRLAVILFGFGLVWFALNVPANESRIACHVQQGVRGEVGVTVTGQRIGGFPWRYCEYTAYSGKQSAGQFALVDWSPAKLCWNIVVGALVGVCLTAIVVRSARRAVSSETKGLQISTAHIMAAVAVFAVLFAWYRYGQQRLIADLDAFAHARGSATASMTAPKWITDVFDLGFLLRVRNGTVWRDNSSAADVQRIADMQSLTSLMVHGASSEENALLARLPKLERLHPADCELDDLLLSQVEANKSIVNLGLDDLSHPLTEQHLARLMEITGDPARVGDGFSLSLPLHRGHPLKLKNGDGLSFLSVSTVVTDADEELASIVPPIRTSAGGFEVELVDMPKLRNVYLPGLSSLVVRDAPRIRRLSLNDGVRDKLVLSNLASLESLFVGYQFPQNSKFDNLPALTVPTGTGHLQGDSADGGILIGGTLTRRVAEQLGEYARFITIPRRCTAEGLATVLPKVKPRKLDFMTSEIAGDVETQANFDAMPDLVELESLTLVPFYSPNRNLPLSLFSILKKAPNLKELIVYEQFGDAQMPLLSRLSKLETLAFLDSQVTDEGWKHLPHMPNLKRLDIPTGITRLELRDMPDLEQLGFQRSRLESIVLENLPKLHTNIASWSEIKSRRRLGHVSVRNIGGLHRLQTKHVPSTFELNGTQVATVSLYGQEIDDDAVRQLVSPGTTKVQIEGTAITSACVDFLLGLEKLEHLDVSLTELTEPDIKRLLAKGNLKYLRADTIELSRETRDSFPGQDVFPQAVPNPLPQPVPSRF